MRLISTIQKHKERASFFIVVLGAFLGLLVLTVTQDAYAGTATYQIAASEDDTTASSGTSGYTQTLTYHPYTNDTRRAFWRWPIMIPKGATITSAYLHVRATGGSGGSGSVAAIQLIDSDSCPSLALPTTYDLAVTGNAVSWPIPDVWADGEWHASPDLKELVQAFIDRPNYKIGSYIALRGSRVSGPFKSVYQRDYGDKLSGAKLEINYTGGVALLDVYMADPHVRTKQKVYVQLGNVSSTDKLVVQLDGTAVVTRNSDLKAEEILTIDYTGLKAGNHQLLFTVLSETGTERASYSRSWTTLHDGVPTVGIDENNNLLVQGKPFFPISFPIWDESKFNNYPYTAPNDYGSVANASLGQGTSVVFSPDTWNKYLSSAQSKGLSGWGPFRWPGLDQYNKRAADWQNQIPIYTQQGKNTPGLLGWIWLDEPNLGGSTSYLTGPMIKQWHNLNRQYDTSHPIMLGLYGYGLGNGSTTDIQRTQEYCYMTNKDLFSDTRTITTDIFAFDYFPYEYQNYFSFASLEDYLLAIDRAREWNYDLIPVMPTIEIQDIHDNKYYPNTYLVPFKNGNGSFVVGQYVKDSIGNKAEIKETRIVGTAPLDAPGHDSLYQDHLALSKIDSGFSMSNGDTLKSCGGTDGLDCALDGSVSAVVGCTDNTKLPQTSVKSGICGPTLGFGSKRNEAWSPSITPIQLKNMIWGSIIHGAKGLQYFQYFGAISVYNLETLRTAKDWITDLTPAILSPDRNATVSHTELNGGRIDVMVKGYGEQTYIFAANIKNQAERVRFAMTGLPAGKNITVYGEARSISSETASFEDDFGALGVHIYIIPQALPGGSTLAPKNFRILY